jgi:hypothetical protein
LTIISALAKISPASAHDLRPGGLVVGVGEADAGTGLRLHAHPMAVVHQLRTDDGVRPTRYSWFLISLGTPMRMGGTGGPGA